MHVFRFVCLRYCERMAKRDNPQERFTDPTPENQAGQVNGRGRPLRVFFLNRPEPARTRVGRLGLVED